jgi:hypothetical protein
MPKLDEHHAVEEVSMRLSARFPNLSADVIRSTVRDEHSKLNGRVRDYVPVLVERAARERLGLLSSTGAQRRPVD